MIEIRIPKEINQYEPKFVGRYTTRETILLSVAGAVEMLLYLNLKDVFSSDSLIPMLMFVAVPFVLLGWYKPYGMPLEKFIKATLISNFLSPRKRLYKIENYHECLQNQYKNSEHLSDESNNEDDSKNNKKKNKKKKIKKEKYKKSKEAIK